jgi:hypothetical protein
MADRHLLDRCTAFGVGDPAICTVRGLLDDGGRLLHRMKWLARASLTPNRSTNLNN